jgi:hypothetical protein
MPLPLPAIVVITPSGVMRRTRKFTKSAISRLPAPSNARFQGDRNEAWVAGPLSPLKPAVPFPA